MEDPWTRTAQRRRLDEKFTELVKELEEFTDAHAMHPTMRAITRSVAGWHDTWRKFCDYADAHRGG